MAALLHVAGPEAIKIYNTFEFVAPAVRSYATVVQRFADYCTPRVNETYERYVFRNCTQMDGEPFDQFVLMLREKVRACNYGLLTDSVIRDQIVCGVADKKIRERLLREENLTMERAVQICQAAEATEKQMKAWDMNASGLGLSLETNAVERQGRRENSSYKRKDNADSCRYCSRTHPKGQCPAYGKICNVCKKRNHFAVVCKSKKDVCFVEQGSRPTDDEDDGDGINDMNGHSHLGISDWMEPLEVGGTVINFKIDTGAQADLMPLNIYDSLKEKPSMKRCSAKLVSYGGHAIKTIGSFKTKLFINEHECLSRMIIVEKGSRPLLGLDTCEKLELVKRIYDITTMNTNDALKDVVKEKFPKLFSGIGCIQEKHTIRLKEDNEPVIQAPRRVPFSLKPRLKQELDRMVEAGIIKKVDGPTDWVSSLVIVEKPDGSLRLCLDPKDLNANIKREHFQIPTREELEAEVGGARYFSKLDAQSGFYQIPLDDASAHLCTFNSPFGRYCFLRLPFGISSAPEIFHKQMVTTFDGMEGLLIYLDDLLIWGRTWAEHNERLFNVMQRASEAGLTLNWKKCVFGVGEITFLGDKISSGGVAPDPSKIAAVLEMPTPTTKQDVLRALGTINYLSKYICNMSMKTSALRSLLRKDAEMCWLPEHEKEWCNLKAMLVSAPVLKLFDPNHDTKLSVDASGTGLGAVLQQKDNGQWRPVAYASRTLLDAESRYAPIEKEALGLVFGCERFHSYIYGKHILLETDHKPLTAIVKKNLAEMSPRLQRMFLRLLRYQFSLQYIPGKQMIIPDVLSRATVSEEQESGDLHLQENDIQIHVDLVMSTLPIGDDMLTNLKEHSQKDPELSKLMKQVQTLSSEDLPKPYNAFQGELCVVNGILLKGTRVVVPNALRKEMLLRIHEGHLGIEKCRRRARQCVYWPGLNRDIENMIQKCATCNQLRFQQPKETLIMRNVPSYPWERVGTDIFHDAGRSYLVVYDAYSNYPEVEVLADTTTSTVKHALLNIFGRHGIPSVVNSDNGPQFSSKEFSQFARWLGFTHTTSSPYFPQSNGLAEKGVQVVKRLLKKCRDSDSDFNLALLNYRTSPLAHGKSPTELLMNRKLRTRLPMVQSVPEAHVAKQNQRESGKTLKDLITGDTVRVLENGQWKTRARVVQKVAPRSYVVRSERGPVMRRNRLHLLRTKETYIPPIDLGLLYNLEEPEGQKALDAGSSDADKDARSSHNERDLPTASRQHDPNLEPLVVTVRRSTRVRKTPLRLGL